MRYQEFYKHVKSNIKVNIRLNFYHEIIRIDFSDGTFANNKILRTNIMHYAQYDVSI